MGGMVESPLRIAGFRRVWAGATVSAVGDAASWIALVAYVWGAHGSVVMLAVLYTAPVALGGWVAGWALDRFDRRWLLIGDSLVRAAAFATVPLVASPSVGHLYLVAAVFGLLKMVSLAGFPAMIPDLVPEPRLMAANALESMSFGLAGLAGAVAAGVAVATAGPGWVLGFDALSYLVFALCLFSARVTSRARRPAVRAARIRVLPLLLRRPVLRDTTIMFMLFNIGEGALLVVLPGRAAGLGWSYGYLVAAMTGGELAASLVLASRPWRPSLVRSVLAASVIAGVVVLAVLSRSPWVVAAGLAGLGACAAAMTTWAQTLRMAVAPAETHGRLFALLRTLMQATPPLGAALTLAGGFTLTVPLIGALMALPALAFARDLLTSSPTLLPVPASAPVPLSSPVPAPARLSSPSRLSTPAPEPSSAPGSAAASPPSVPSMLSPSLPPPPEAAGNDARRAG